MEEFMPAIFIAVFIINVLAGVFALGIFKDYVKNTKHDSEPTKREQRSSERRLTEYIRRLDEEDNEMGARRKWRN